MKPILREALPEFIAGIAAAVVLLVIGHISGILGLNSPDTVNRILVICLYALILAVTIYIFRAKRKTLVEPPQILPRFNRLTRGFFVVLVIATTVFTGWFVFLVPSTASFTIPPLVINLINPTDQDVFVSEGADFSLLVGARVSVGTTVATGRLHLVPVGAPEQDTLKVPAKGELHLLGYFRNPLQYRTYLENGNTDILLYIYHTGSGFFWNNQVFPFDRNYLNKYRLDIETK